MVGGSQAAEMQAMNIILSRSWKRWQEGRPWRSFAG